MFNLEQAIANWRQQMITAGIKTSALLDELESHLRDEVEQLEHSGLDSKQAFELAVGRMGQGITLKHEFNKVAANERKLMKKIIIITAGIVGILVGMAIVMPALANYGNEGSMTRQSIGFLLLGMIIVLGSAGVTYRSIKRRKA